MRVIAGLAKGRRLKAPKGLSTRPTTDRVKESLFSILGCRCEGAAVLDLFAGSGAMAIESLSRGAERATLIDSSASAVSAITENLAIAGFAGLAEVHKADYLRAVDAMARSRKSFDLVFIDPPYGHGLDIAAVDAVSSRGILSPGAMVVVEHSGKEVFTPPDASHLQVVRTERYGDTSLSFLVEVRPCE